MKKYTKVLTCSTHETKTHPRASRQVPPQHVEGIPLATVHAFGQEVSPRDPACRGPGPVLRPSHRDAARLVEGAGEGAVPGPVVLERRPHPVPSGPGQAPLLPSGHPEASTPGPFPQPLGFHTNFRPRTDCLEAAAQPGQPLPETTTPATYSGNLGPIQSLRCIFLGQDGQNQQHRHLREIDPETTV